MSEQDLLELLKEKEQLHLVDYYQQLSENEQTRLKEQIEGIDWTLLDCLKQKDEESKKGTITPLHACTIGEIDNNRQRYERIGLEKIKEGKVAAVLLAGGQGSRLGCDGPKGTVNIGINHELYIFEMLFRNTMEVTKLAGVSIPFFIMTSEKNHEQTVQFLEEHNYFGYPKDEVMCFTQEMAPCVDFNGHILMEEKDRIAFSPNGNGGWFQSMKKHGILDILHEKGIEWLNVFAVDNVLQKICDPTFIGAVIDAGMVSGSKVVRKVSPQERVGVMCLEDNKPSIIEYYEMTQEMLDEKNEDGDYAYNYGVTLNYLFRVDCLEQILNSNLPIHYAKKKIPYVTVDGQSMKPTEPNGYKFEFFILDMIHMLENCLPYEVVRNKEFAPIKNATGTDSMESARKLLLENGVEL